MSLKSHLQETSVKSDLSPSQRKIHSSAASNNLNKSSTGLLRQPKASGGSHFWRQVTICSLVAYKNLISKCEMTNFGCLSFSFIVSLCMFSKSCTDVFLICSCPNPTACQCFSQCIQTRSELCFNSSRWVSWNSWSSQLSANITQTRAKNNDASVGECFQLQIKNTLEQQDGRTWDRLKIPV